MHTKPDTFADLLALWETPKALSEALGVKYVTAQVMKHRKSVDDAHWPTLIEQARARGVEITLADLLAMKRQRAAEREAERKADNDARRSVEGQAA